MKAQQVSGTSATTPGATAAQTTLRAAADALLTAELSRTPISPVSQRHPDFTVDDAYAIQAINRETRLRDGAEIIGHKVGLTSKPMQDMLGVSEPDSGQIYQDRVTEDGGAVDTGRLISPRVEPEIAFVLATDLVGPGILAEDVLAATDYVLPALEVIDSRIRDWKIGLVDTIADNASFARIVLGTQRTKTGDVDLAAAAVELYVDGKVRHQGAGAAVLGHPANAVAWLANTLSRSGMKLGRGDVILPGSMTAAISLASDSVITADFGALGQVTVSAV